MTLRKERRHLRSVHVLVIVLVATYFAQGVAAVCGRALDQVAASGDAPYVAVPRHAVQRREALGSDERSKMAVDGANSSLPVTVTKSVATPSCRLPCTCNTGPQIKTSHAATPRLSVGLSFDDMSEKDVSAMTICQRDDVS